MFFGQLVPKLFYTNRFLHFSFGPQQSNQFPEHSDAAIGLRPRIPDLC